MADHLWAVVCVEFFPVFCYYTNSMHAPGKGICEYKRMILTVSLVFLTWYPLSASSSLPYRRSQPSWSKVTPEEVCDQIFKLARRGLGPSQIGVILRDSHGVPQVRFITGNKIMRILKSNG